MFKDSAARTGPGEDGGFSEQLGTTGIGGFSHEVSLLDLLRSRMNRNVGDVELDTMTSVFDSLIEDSDLTDEIKSDTRWLMRRIGNTSRVDAVRIASRVRSIEESPIALERRASGHFEFEYSPDCTSLGNGTIRLYSKRIREMTRTRRRILIAHELGHAATFEYEMCKRLPDDYSPKWLEAVSEVCANLHVYKWGLGKQMRRLQYEFPYHLPGHCVVIDRRRYRVTNRWTFLPL